MGYRVETYTVSSTGNKIFAPSLGGATPYAARMTVGARNNTTETSAYQSEGKTDGSFTVCHSFAPSFAKHWPYSGESSYLAALYTAAGTKVMSCTFTSWAADDFRINVDVLTVAQKVTVEYWY